MSRAIGVAGVKSCDHSACGESVRWGERLRAADEADRVARGDSGLGDMRAGGRRMVGTAIHRRGKANIDDVGGDESGYDEDGGHCDDGFIWPASAKVRQCS